VGVEVGDSVGECVGDSVGDTVGTAVGDLVGETVTVLSESSLPPEITKIKSTTYTYTSTFAVIK